MENAGQRLKRAFSIFYDRYDPGYNTRSGYRGLADARSTPPGTGAIPRYTACDYIRARATFALPGSPRPDIPLAIISGRGLPGKANVADFVLNSEQSSAREANFENCGGNLGRQRRHLRRAAAGAAAPESGRGNPPGAHPRGRKDFVPGNRKPRCGP